MLLLLLLLLLFCVLVLLLPRFNYRCVAVFSKKKDCGLQHRLAGSSKAHTTWLCELCGDHQISLRYVVWGTVSGVRGGLHPKVQRRQSLGSWEVLQRGFRRPGIRYSTASIFL